MQVLRKAKRCTGGGRGWVQAFKAELHAGGNSDQALTQQSAYATAAPFSENLKAPEEIDHVVAHERLCEGG